VALAGSQVERAQRYLYKGPKEPVDGGGGGGDLADLGEANVGAEESTIIRSNMSPLHPLTAPTETHAVDEATQSVRDNAAKRSKITLAKRPKKTFG